MAFVKGHVLDERDSLASHEVLRVGEKLLFCPPIGYLLMLCSLSEQERKGSEESWPGRASTGLWSGQS